MAQAALLVRNRTVLALCVLGLACANLASCSADRTFGGEAASRGAAGDAAVAPEDSPPAANPPTDRDDTPRDASSDGLTPPPYPNCLEALDGGGYRAWLACDSSKTCVFPCSSCSGATNMCTVSSSAGNVSRCAASCATCTSGTAALPDSCSGTCTNLATDFRNCGTCARRCQASSHAGGALCSAAHCCPQIDRGGGILTPSTWTPSCGMCCVDGCADAGGLCVPEGTN